MSAKLSAAITAGQERIPAAEIWVGDAIVFRSYVWTVTGTRVEPCGDVRLTLVTRYGEHDENVREAGFWFRATASVTRLCAVCDRFHENDD